MHLIFKSLLREQLGNPWQLLLALTSVAIGVAVIVGVDVANKTALEEFNRANKLTDGVATHRIVGRERGVNEEVLKLIKVDLKVRDAAPVVVSKIAVSGSSQVFELMGVDLVSDYRIRSLGSGIDRNSNSPEAWTLYASLDQSISSLVAHFDGRQQSFNVLPLPGSKEKLSAATAHLLLTDIAWAQKFLGKEGLLDRIDLKLNSQEQVARIRDALPQGVRILQLGMFNNARSEMTKAFRTNLIALSLLAILIAIFLIYSSVSFQVVRRRRMIALLRSSGVSSRLLGLSLLWEVFVLGLCGSTIGILLGVLLSEGLTALVNQTINALYFSVAATAAELSFSTVIKALIVGCGATLFAALLPIWRYSRATTRQLLANEVGHFDFTKFIQWSPWLFLGGIILGLVMLWIPVDSLIPPFGGLFLVVLSMTVLVPLILHRLCHYILRLSVVKNQLLVKLSLRNIRSYLGQTAVAVSALAVAVSASLGVALMVSSFRMSVDNWLQQYLQADIYLTSESAEDPRLQDVFLNSLDGLDGVNAVSRGHRRELVTDRGPLEVFTLDTNLQGFSGFQVLSASSSDLWADFIGKPTALISEPLARRLDLTPGDSLLLPGTNASVEIIAVYRDYSSDRGLVTISEDTHRQLFGQLSWKAAALYLDQHTDVEGTMELIRGLPMAPQKLFLRSNRGLRESSFEVFDQTFRITGVLKWLSLVVAVVGMISALITLQLARVREYAALKAAGFSNLQLAKQIFYESGFTGLVTGFLAVPIGIVLAVVLIEVINVRSFGWSMSTVIHWSFAIDAVVVSLFAALVSCIYPVYRLSRTSITEGLRHR